MENNILNHPAFEMVKAGGKLLPFLKTKRFVLKENGSEVKKETIYFNKNQLSGLMNALSAQSFSGVKPIEIVSAQGGCYMDVATTDDRQFAAVQLYEYVPFAFYPVNDMYQLRGKQAEDFLAYLDKCRKTVKQ
jgi:hypothetical protein